MFAEARKRKRRKKKGVEVPGASKIRRMGGHLSFVFLRRSAERRSKTQQKRREEIRTTERESNRARFSSTFQEEKLWRNFLDDEAKMAMNDRTVFSFFFFSFFFSFLSSSAF
jgi:hypothetical protein